MSYSQHDLIEKARQDCKQAGHRLTPKRENVLRLMERNEQPESAYELADRYKQTYGENLSAMSVYRILNVLIDAGLVHKLECNNQYVLCSHITCQHEHQQAQFLICDRCHKAEEVGISPSLMRQLTSSVANSGFKIKNLQLELHGVCRECQTK